MLTICVAFMPNGYAIKVDWLISYAELSDQCGPCKVSYSSSIYLSSRSDLCISQVIGPIFDRLSNQYKQAVFLKCDVDAVKDVAAKVSVHAREEYI